MKKAIWTLSILLVLCYQFGIGYTRKELISGHYRDIFLLFVLSTFLYFIQKKENFKFVVLLYKSFKISMLTLLLHIPLNILASIRIVGDTRSIISNVLNGLPKIISEFIITSIMFIPIILISTLVCYLLLKKKKEKPMLEDHLLGNE